MFLTIVLRIKIIYHLPIEKEDRGYKISSVIFLDKHCICIHKCLYVD